ncbi:transcription factor RSL3-like [Zingiber officinale]|uniref:BHLH domain-containing protein n=1 Tax=Zingiber officinale TaxID=94328 RepID=A0A8J5M1B6_ZINOF|nr:transcription factor RSL3-like [Zingiber officinale]KAG6531311.1 hypothetical protein ZIOFF_005116 [Zingiber officinale]
MEMEGSYGEEVPEIVEKLFEQDHRHDPSFRLPLVPWSDGGFFAPQFGYDGYSCLNESDAIPAMPSMDCSMEGCQIPEPAISSTSAFEDLAHFINADASSNEIEEFSCVNLPQIVPVPLGDQMPKTTRKHMVDISSERSGKAQVSPNVSTKMQVKRSVTSKRGQKRTMNFVQEGGDKTDNSINSCSYITEDQEEPSSNPQSIYARKRRERINERLKILQSLVPNGTKVDISTMLEEAVDYVKFLQLQIKLLSSDELWMYAPIAYNGVNIGLDLKISPLQEK